jgi:hypothetical protein
VAFEDLEVLFSFEGLPQLAPRGGRFEPVVRRVEDEGGLGVEAGEVVVDASFAEGGDQTVRGL